MFIKPYLLAFVWLVVITVLSISPGVPMPKFNLLSVDKIGHAGAYALLTWFMFRGFKAANSRPANWKESMVIFSLSTAYGVLMEFVQGTFFPYRFFEVDDMLANAFGALVATIGYMFKWGIGYTGRTR
jgi:VanZ family protein